jgi:hypothetical protein
LLGGIKWKVKKQNLEFQYLINGNGFIKENKKNG